MSIERSQIVVGGLPVQIVRKAIKNLHLGVYPPHGRVRVAAPLRVTNEAIRLAVIGKLGWIKRQRTRFEGQPRESQREMVSGESHYYFLGRRYRLRVMHATGASGVVLRTRTRMELHARPDASAAQRNRVLQRWYRQELKKIIPPLLEKWQAVLGVHVADWGISSKRARMIPSASRAAGGRWSPLPAPDCLPVTAGSPASWG